MATQLQLRRGNTVQTLAFTGAIAEVTVDTAQNTLTVHNGVTPGGNYLVNKGQFEANVANLQIFAQAAYNAANSAGGDTASANTIILQGVDLTQNTNITAVNTYAGSAYAAANLALGIDATQNTNITAVNTYAASAYGVANTNSTDISVIQGVNTTQNTNITAVNTYAGSAYAAANLALGIDATQNTNITAVNTYAGSAFNKANNALPLTGGSISGSISISQDLSVSGNLVVLGNTISLNTTTFVVNDSLILLGQGNYTSDVLDIGFVGHYNDGTNAHAGLIRDFDNKDWYLFKGYTPQVDANNNVDLNHASFSKANLQSDYVKSNLIATTAVVNGLDIFNYVTSAYAAGNTNATNITAVNTYAASAYGVANTATNTLGYTYVTAGGYGSATAVPAITLAANGRVVAVTSTNIQSGTTGQIGLVQLTDSVTSTSTTTAGTPNSIKIAYDRAQAAFTAANTASGGGGGTAPNANTFSQIMFIHGFMSNL